MMSWPIKVIYTSVCQRPSPANVKTMAGGGVLQSTYTHFEGEFVQVGGEGKEEGGGEKRTHISQYTDMIIPAPFSHAHAPRHDPQPKEERLHQEGAHAGAQVVRVDRVDPPGEAAVLIEETQTGCGRERDKSQGLFFSIHKKRKKRKKKKRGGGGGGSSFVSNAVVVIQVLTKVIRVRRGIPVNTVPGLVDGPL